MLRDRFWDNSPDNKVDESNVGHAIGVIRKALSGNSSSEEYIETVPVGKICFVGEVKEVDFIEGTSSEVVRGELETSQQNALLSSQVSDDENTLTPHAKITTPAAASKGTIKAFQEWHRGPGKTMKRGIMVCVALTLIVSIVLCCFEMIEGAVLFASGAQLVIIAILFFKYWPIPEEFKEVEKDSISTKKAVETLGYKNPEALNQAIEAATELQRQYAFYWRRAWFAWCIFYAAIFSTYLYRLQNPLGPSNDYPWLFTFKDLVNNFNTMFIILCYLILYRPVVGKNSVRSKSTTSWWAKDIATTGTACVVIPLFIETVTIMILYHPPAESTLLLYLQQGFSLVSGIAGGIAIALYVGRLQSKYFDPPALLIIALFSYTAIQPFYWDLSAPQLFADARLSKVKSVQVLSAKLDDKEETDPEDPQLKKLTEHLDREHTRSLISQVATVVLIILTLFLKCWLFLYTTWVLKSRRLLFYLERMGKIYQKQVENEWETFRDLMQENA